MRSPLAALLVFSIASAQPSTSHLHSLAATERAFAAATRHIGVRNGFLTFFAEDAVALRPVVGPYRETLVQRPQPPQPLPSLLLWTPTEGDVSRAGDLGWLTGPSAVRENKPGGKVVYTGQYFSVWKRQRDGTWKVLLDAGVETPSATADPETAPFAPHVLFDPEPDTAVRGTAAQLAETESQLNAAWSRSGLQAAGFYASSARFHADSLMPVTGTNAVRDHLRNIPGLPHRSMASASSVWGDLGYSYGDYLESGRTMYYIRAWKYLKNEGWRVAVEWVG